MKRTGKLVGGMIAVAVIGTLVTCERSGETDIAAVFSDAICEYIAETLTVSFFPGTAAEWLDSETFWPLQSELEQIMPVYGYVRTGRTIVGKKPMKEFAKSSSEFVKQADGMYSEVSAQGPDTEGTDNEGTDTEGIDAEKSNTEEDGSGMSSTGEFHSYEVDLGEGETGEDISKEPTKPFLQHDIVNPIDIETLCDYETLLREFYTVDSSTYTDSSLLDAEKFLDKKFTVDKEAGGPQILIYHTHSMEAYEGGTEPATVVDVGERLKNILEQEYGFSVLHHVEAYDAVDRDHAYSLALTGMEQVLKDNPSIQLVIDLHRDEMAEDTRLVLNMDGRPTAKFMFFNGLSRTRKTGRIDYLKNENLEDNLALSFQMKLAAEEYYPGLTRKIYLKGYRYNMHLAKQYLLVELGAQNNTAQEAFNACDPLAHILSVVLDN